MNSKTGPLLLLLLLCCSFAPPKAAAQAAAEDSLSFVVLSHVYPLLFNGAEADRERLLAELKKCKPEVIILTGDVIKGTWHVAEQREQQFKNEQALQDSLAEQWQFVKQYFGQLGVPVWLAPGNHDISSALPQNRQTVREAFLAQEFEPDFRKTLKKRTFLFLNTTQENGKYELSEQQLQWLQEQLKINSEAETFLFLHHPLWYRHLQPGEWQAEWLRQVQPGLQETVRYVFSGDGDDCLPFYFETRGGTSYYTTGSGSRLATFLHVQCLGQDVKVEPKTFQLTPAVAPPAPGLSNQFKQLLRLKTFWAGIAVGAGIVSLLLLLALRLRKIR